MLASTLSLFMLISTLVQSAAACMTRVRYRSWSTSPRCCVQISTPSAIAATATTPSTAEPMPKPVKTGPSSSSWSGVGSSSGMAVRLPGDFWKNVGVTVEATPGGAGATNGSGIDLSYVNSDARPQDDLFGHVNGRWLADYEIPADRATDGAFRTLFDRAEEQVRDLIIGAAATSGSGAAASSGTDEQRIGDLYASFMDEQAVAVLGVQPLLDELATIDDAADATALAAVLGALQRTGAGGGTGIYVDTDSKDSTRYLVHLSQSGLGLPDESYYRDEQHAEILAAYPQHIAAMFTLVYGGDHSETAARIVALETKLAAAHWDVVKRRDADLTYNLRRFADLSAEAPGFDWAGWVTALGASPGAIAELVVRQPDYLTAFAAAWSGVDLETWKAWARWRLIHGRASLP